jgi:hypothetical protein
MNTVVLKQIRFHRPLIGNACQQERHNRDVLGFGNPAEEPPKPFGIRGSKIWWDHHPGQYRLGAGLPDSHHHRLESVFGCLQRESPECIIGAQLDQNPARTDSGQNSRKSTASTGGCFTADAGIDDLNLATTLLQAALDERREHIEQHTMLCVRSWRWQKQERPHGLLLPPKESERALKLMTEAEKKSYRPAYTALVKEYVQISTNTHECSVQ